MKTVIYCSIPRKDFRSRKLKSKFPNYSIRRRISTIREKIIARKYGILYLRKVFGRYYPSECKRYYKKKILRKYFGELCIWKPTTHRKTKYQLIRRNAIELYHLMCTLLLLLKLARYSYHEMEENSLEIKSILRGRIFILRKFTSKWKMYIIQQKNCRSLRSKATNYYRSKVSTIYFLHWQRTTSQIVEKKNMQLASKFYNDLSSSKLFKTWRRYVEHKSQNRRLKHKANFFYIMRLKQKVLDALSKNVTCCKNIRLAIQKLKLFYRRLLTMTVWSKWMKLIDEKTDSDSRDKLLLGISFYKRSTTRKYFIKWVGYHTNEQKKKSLKLRAIDLCKTYYCQKYLHVWKMVYRKNRKIIKLEEKALKFSNVSLMRNAILQWIKCYNYTISMKVNHEKSDLHYEKKIRSKCFASWINYCNEKIQNDNLINEARAYYLEILQRKALNKLSMNVSKMKIKQEQIQVAENFYKMNLLTKAFLNWIELCIHLKKIKIQVAKFDEKIRNKLKLNIILQWKLYVHHKKCSHRKTLMSISHRRKKACSRIFERLKNYVNYKKGKKFRLTYVEYGVKKIQENSKNIYFQHWRVARLNVLKEKRRMFRAEEFHEFHSKHKYFLLWKTFLIHQRMKCQHQNNLNNKINCFILKRFLRVWYTRYQLLLDNHFNERWACRVYEMKIMHRHFIAWKYFTEICTKERREINDAKEFRKKLVVKEGLQRLVKLFLCNTELRYATKMRNVEINSSYEFDLVRTYFNKWHKSVSTKTKNWLQGIKHQTDLKNVIPENLKINDRKYVSNLIPRFVIPDFMKKEIKLSSGIGQYSNEIPIDASVRETLKSDRISKADRSFADYKLSKNILQPRMNDNRQGRDQFNLNNDIRLQYLRQNIKLISPNETSHILSPDSLKSDTDSAKTFIVQNPVYYKNLDSKSPSRNSLRPEVLGKNYNKENNYKLLPPAAFYVSLKD